MVGYIAHVLIELWRPITFDPITYLIVSIGHEIRLIELNKNNYIARLANDLFKSYGPPKFYKKIGYITDHYGLFYIRLVMKRSSLCGNSLCRDSTVLGLNSAL